MLTYLKSLECGAKIAWIGFLLAQKTFYVNLTCNTCS